MMSAQSDFCRALDRLADSLSADLWCAIFLLQKALEMCSLWSIVFLKIIEITSKRGCISTYLGAINGYFVKFSEFGALRQSNRKDGSILPNEILLRKLQMLVFSYNINFTETVSSFLEYYTQDSQVFRSQILSINPQIFSGRHLSPAKCFSMNWGWTILLQQFLVPFSRITFVL